MNKPELVLPAGSLEKLQTALLFGADAVYLGGKEFSLRAYAGNLTLAEMAEGLAFARRRGKKVYITVNVLARHRDIEKLPAYLEKLAELNPDGLIISDPGVLRLAQKYSPGIPITISTQANVSNYEAAAFYRDLGAQRIVLARELSLVEIAAIKARVEIEIEVFVHGAMCVSYSGRCLLSHYMTGRSANLGACAHPCRYRYALMEEKRPGEYFALEEDEQGSYILNSRDLCLLEFIPELIETGVEAFKVEGRMKSPLYVGSAASVYRQAIDNCRKAGKAYTPDEISRWMTELQGTATRPFTNGFISGETTGLQDLTKSGLPEERLEFCGMVIGYREDCRMIEVEQRANFGPGDQLEFLIPGGKIANLELTSLFDEELQPLDRARHPRQKVLCPSDKPAPAHSILRRVVKQHEG